MELSEMNDHLGKIIGAEVSVQLWDNNPVWDRVFIIRPDGCTICRMPFKNKMLYNEHWYKNKCLGDLGLDFDESDMIQAKFMLYSQARTELSYSDYWVLVEGARYKAKQLWDAKVTKRQLLPQTRPDGSKWKRASLQRVDPRRVFYNLVQDMITIIDARKWGIDV